MTPKEAKAQEIAVVIYNTLSAAGHDDAAAFVCRPFVKAKIEALLND